MVDLNLPQLFPQTKLPPKGRYIPLEIEYEANFESKLVLRKLILQIKVVAVVTFMYYVTVTNNFLQHQALLLRSSMRHVKTWNFGTSYKMTLNKFSCFFHWKKNWSSNNTKGNKTVLPLKLRYPYNLGSFLQTWKFTKLQTEIKFVTSFI